MSARASRPWAEAFALAVSPAAAYFVLRIRLMPIADLNDPAMHTTYMIDPQSIFLRYSAAFESSQRLREGARVGLLLPGRISYLLFGGLPGFVVLRYVLALVAVVPAYLLLRRLFGRAAGAVGVIVILGCPVILTAWGTDFPDSATISYLIAGLACLAMPSARRRVLWLAGSAAFFTVAVWTFASSTVLIAATVAAYAVIRWRRDRVNVLRDIEIVAAVAIAVTAVLAAGSYVLLGQLDFILPTIKSVIYLAHGSNVVLNHSAGPAWAPYLSYLLVLPAVAGLWFVAFGHRLGQLPTPQLIVGAACTCQLAIAVLLQFFGGVQLLEEHYFSSLLWAGVSVTLAMALVQMGRSMLDQQRLAWVLPLLLVAVPLAYEVDPHVPPSGWVSVRRRDARDHRRHRRRGRPIAPCDPSARDAARDVRGARVDRRMSPDPDHRARTQPRETAEYGGEPGAPIRHRAGRYRHACREPLRGDDGASRIRRAGDVLG